MAEVVRSVAPQRTIEPTTAVSKERSRSENNTSDTSAATGAFYTSKGNNKGFERDRASELALAHRDQETQPPAEKSEIQKAMEVQIKELLSNVWKASAKAVDFLLQRETVSANENALTTLEPAAVLGKSAVAIAATQGAATNGAVISYNAQGGRLSDAVTTTGQLVDVLV
jgi:hypothetical protein